MRALTEFTNEETMRTAITYEKDGEYGVLLYRKGVPVDDRKCTGHTLRYAEDLAENFINRWGEFRV